jgi:hypothetical protein
MSSGTLEKELDGIGSLDLLEGTGSLAGQRERGHSVDPLAADAKRFAGGGQKVHLGTAAIELVGELGASVNEVLAIVQDDEEVLVREDLD